MTVRPTHSSGATVTQRLFNRLRNPIGRRRHAGLLRGLIFAALTGLTAGVPLEPVAAQPVPSHAPTPAPYATLGGAHGRYSKAPINLGSPNLALTASVVVAGGGAQTFDAGKLLDALTAGGPIAQTEMNALRKKFGADNVASFTKAFDFVIDDALAQMSKSGMALPSAALPDAANGKLAAALSAAGMTPRGSFDVEYLLDTLVTHPIHVQIMNDIDASPEFGPLADANYHAVLAQLFADVKKAEPSKV